jgi:hypothetical protein
VVEVSGGSDNTLPARSVRLPAAIERASTFPRISTAPVKLIGVDITVLTPLDPYDAVAPRTASALDSLAPFFTVTLSNR